MSSPTPKLSLFSWLLVVSCSAPEMRRQIPPEPASVAPAPTSTHWSFQPPRTEGPPAVEADWVRNDIDRFVLAGLQHQALTPSAEAAPDKLLRRVSLDITGLPPTLPELDAFIANPSDEAYSAALDRLLASPRYAEHMASEWLDLARYADTDGFQYDITRPGWPWRDWVINAFDTNLSYDEFTVQQLAGDLLPDATEQTILATAFLRNHAIQGENGLLRDEFRDLYVADRVDTLGKTWLGLTTGCAKCHDHKFDPLSHQDYYRLYDCFNQIDEKDNGPTSSFSPVKPLKSPLAADIAADLDARIADLNTIHAPAHEVAQLETEKQQALAPHQARIMKDMAEPRATRQLMLGRYDSPIGEPLKCAAPTVFPAFPTGEAPNRLGLARWLVMPEHPLTSRVTVNRIWRHYFGRGLIDPVDNFGHQIAAPPQQPLLDWLARWFVSSGWDLKALHRLIVTSSTYRQSSQTDAATLVADEDNRWLGRGPRKRLRAEEVRDLPLFVSGLLIERAGGPPVFPYQPDGLWREMAWEANLLSYPQLTGDGLYRRSIYGFWKRTLPPPLMSVFDAPDRENSNAYREPGITPQQALALLNSRQFIEAARHLAANALAAASGDVRVAITIAFRQVTSRAPADSELDVLTALYDRQLLELDSRDGSSAAIQSSGHSPNGPITSTAAALTQVMRVLFNLSETITKD